MKYRIFLLLFVAALLVACHQVGLKEYHSDVTYICFTKDATKDTLFFSFKVHGTDTAEIPIAVRRMGKFSTEDLEYQIETDAGRTSLPADCYELPTRCVFRKCLTEDTLYVRLFNDPELQNVPKMLVLKIKPLFQVEEGIMANRRYFIQASDRLVRPTWWTELNGGSNGHYFFNIAEQYYLGKYSELKYSLFLAELNKDGVEFDGKDLNILRMYSLRVKRYLEDYYYENDDFLWDEENGEIMTVPVAG